MKNVLSVIWISFFSLSYVFQVLSCIDLPRKRQKSLLPSPNYYCKFGDLFLSDVYNRVHYNFILFLLHIFIGKQKTQYIKISLLNPEFILQILKYTITMSHYQVKNQMIYFAFAKTHINLRILLNVQKKSNKLQSLYLMNLKIHHSLNKPIVCTCFFKHLKVYQLQLPNKLCVADYLPETAEKLWERLNLDILKNKILRGSGFVGIEYYNLYFLYVVFINWWLHSLPYFNRISQKNWKFTYIVDRNPRETETHIIVSNTEYLEKILDNKDYQRQLEMYRVIDAFHYKNALFEIANFLKNDQIEYHAFIHEKLDKKVSAILEIILQKDPHLSINIVIKENKDTKKYQFYISINGPGQNDAIVEMLMQNIEPSPHQFESEMMFLLQPLVLANWAY